MKLIRGRLVLRSVGKAGVQLVVEVNGHAGIVTFNDPVASGAIETFLSASRAPIPRPRPVLRRPISTPKKGRCRGPQTPSMSRWPLRRRRLTLGPQPVRTALTAEQLPTWIAGEPLGSWTSWPRPNWNAAWRSMRP